MTPLSRDQDWLTVDLDVHGGRLAQRVCTVPWETTDRRPHHTDRQPAGTTTRRWIEPMRASAREPRERPLRTWYLALALQPPSAFERDVQAS